MAKKIKSLQNWLIPHLRNIYRMWPQKNEARAAARVQVEVGSYKNGNPIFKTMFKCADCEELFPREEIQVDHKDPVVSVSGFTTWDDYINNLFCDFNNLQCLCIECHKSKTFLENEIRKENRKKVKK